MNKSLGRIASILALIIGLMAVVAGGRVLLGKDPGYYVINWLVLYNYTIGILAVFVAAPLIWSNHRYAMPAATGIFGLHVLVMLILLSGYREVVAPDSIVAMSLRISVWAAILVLMVLQSRKNRKAAILKTYG